MKMQSREIFEQWAEDHYFDPNFTVKPYNGEYYDPVMEHSFEIFSAGWKSSQDERKEIDDGGWEAGIAAELEGYNQ